MLWLTKHLFNGVWKDDIFRSDGRKVWYKNKALDSEQRAALREDAERFYNSVIWKILKDECTYQANLKQFKAGVSEIDLLAGRMMLYNLEIIDTILKDKLTKM